MTPQALDGRQPAPDQEGAPPWRLLVPVGLAVAALSGGAFALWIALGPAILLDLVAVFCG